MPSKRIFTEAEVERLVKTRNSPKFLRLFRENKRYPQVLQDLWINVMKEAELPFSSKVVKEKYNALLSRFRTQIKLFKQGDETFKRWKFWKLMEKYCLSIFDDNTVNSNGDENTLVHGVEEKLNNFKPFANFKKKESESESDLDLDDVTLKLLYEEFLEYIEGKNIILYKKPDNDEKPNDLMNKINIMKTDINEIKRKINRVHRLVCKLIKNQKKILEQDYCSQ